MSLISSTEYFCRPRLLKPGFLPNSSVILYFSHSIRDMSRERLLFFRIETENIKVSKAQMNSRAHLTTLSPQGFTQSPLLSKVHEPTQSMTYNIFKSHLRPKGKNYSLNVSSFMKWYYTSVNICCSQLSEF